MRSRPVPSRNPTVLGDNPSTLSGKGSGFRSCGHADIVGRDRRQPKDAPSRNQHEIHCAWQQQPGPRQADESRARQTSYGGAPGRITRPASPWFEIGTGTGLWRSIDDHAPRRSHGTLDNWAPCSLLLLAHLCASLPKTERCRHCSRRRRTLSVSARPAGCHLPRRERPPAAQILATSCPYRRE